ncbi:MAG TPA: hypothetical protein ENN17_12780 [bacterium]|nr:hypothetical protein [bacterium]
MKSPSKSILFGLCLLALPAREGFPSAPVNYLSFPIAERVAGDPYLNNHEIVIGDQFFAADFTGDGRMDYSFRSHSRIYVYTHDGVLLWSRACSHPGGNGGAKHAAADLNGNGRNELIAIDHYDGVFVFDVVEDRVLAEYRIPGLLSGQRLGHVMAANLRGAGDRDAILQTLDLTPQYGGISYYLNRSLIALNLEDGEVIWRVEQDADTRNGIYEGYWGQAHGPAFCADIDGDGIDEVIGANLIYTEGGRARVADLGYPDRWIDVVPSERYIDHLDAIAVGDIRPDREGIEWIVLEEDDRQYASYHTTLLAADGILWRREASELRGAPGFDYNPAVSNQNFEPQNVAAGNFDPDRPGREIWNRSRFEGQNGFSQHPWVYDATGNLIAHYRTDAVLPAGFNTHDNGNAEGLEMIWTIDWRGGAKEYIAAKARHITGEAGVFDALTGEALFVTGRDGIPSVRVSFLYVADVDGDGREELIVCDETESGPTLRFFRNEAPSLAPVNLSKWNDPLYRRLKQNWNYYSPGSYTRPDMMLLDVRIRLEGFYSQTAGVHRTALNDQGRIPLISPYPEDPRRVRRIPDGAADWVLLRLRRTPDSEPAAERSVFLLHDGRLVTEDDPDGPVPFSVQAGGYHVSVLHRNHFPVTSAAPVRLAAWQTVQMDFQASGAAVHDPGTVKGLADGTWAAVAGDANRDGLITIADRNRLMARIGESGYFDEDLNGDGVVTEQDVVFVTNNRNRACGE